MSWALIAAQLILMIALPPAQISVGTRVGSWVFRLFGTTGSIPVACAFLLGLSLQLFFTLLLSVVLSGIGGSAWVLPLSTLFIFLVTPPSEFFRVTARASRPSAIFVLWILVTAVLGWNLFRTSNGITTLWRNNYGDLPMHLGMITSFVFGENLPSEHFAFPGHPLSYPLFVNLWTSLLWWPHPTFEILPLIFCFQWTLLWCCVWAAFPRGSLVLPVAVLLAGGSYDVIWKAFSEPNGEVMDFFGNGVQRDRFSWHPLLTSVWIPQRTALYGLAVLSTSFFLFESFNRRIQPREGLGLLALCGLLLSFTVLGHGHFALAGMAYFALLLLLRIFRKLETAARRESVHTLLLFLIALAPLALSLPFIRGKSTMLTFTAGWMPWTVFDKATQFSAILNATLTWFHFGIFVIPYLVVAWFFFRAKLELFTLTIVFVTFNVVQLAYWEWDQIKLFAPLMVIFVLLLAWRTPWPQSPIRNALAQLLFIPLFLPGLVDLAQTAASARQIPVFTAEDVAVGDEIRQGTEPCAVVLAKPDHNSPVMLSGRRIYLGYPGWIWSQGFSFEERMSVVRNRLNDSLKLVAADALLREECARYLLWTDRERSVWTQDSPDSLDAPRVSPNLYRIR